MQDEKNTSSFGREAWEAACKEQEVAGDSIYDFQAERGLASAHCSSFDHFFWGQEHRWPGGLAAGILGQSGAHRQSREQMRPLIHVCSGCGFDVSVEPGKVWQRPIMLNCHGPSNTAPAFTEPPQETNFARCELYGKYRSRGFEARFARDHVFDASGPCPAHFRNPSPELYWSLWWVVHLPRTKSPQAWHRQVLVGSGSDCPQSTASCARPPIAATRCLVEVLGFPCNQFGGQAGNVMSQSRRGCNRS